MKREALDHRKTRRVVRKLGWPRFQVWGLLEGLWAHTAQWHASGRFARSKWDDFCEWADLEEELWQPVLLALLDAGYLDELGDELVVHDWLEHCDRYVKRKLDRWSKKGEVIQGEDEDELPEASGHGQPNAAMAGNDGPWPLARTGTGSGTGSGSSSSGRSTKEQDQEKPPTRRNASGAELRSGLWYAPEDFELGPPLRAYAAALIPGDQIDIAFECFRNHGFRENPGDLEKRWKRWVAVEAQRVKSGQKAAWSGFDSDAARNARIAKIIADNERQKREFEERERNAIGGST